MARPSNLRSSAHVAYSIKYHIVWITKYRRRKFLEQHRERCKEVIQAICTEYEWIIEALDVSVDHVHVYLSTEPTDRPCDVVAILKAQSASKIKEEFPELKAGKGRVWGRGYFLSSVNDCTTSSIIIQYIRKQNHEEQRTERQLRLF